MDLHQNFTTDVSVHKEELVKFWKLPASRSGSRNFLKDSSTMPDRVFFHILAYICGESGRIFMKILSQMHPWRKKSPLKFGSNPIQSSYPYTDPDHILLGGGMRSLTALDLSFLNGRLILLSRSNPLFIVPRHILSGYYKKIVGNFLSNPADEQPQQINGGKRRSMQRQQRCHHFAFQNSLQQTTAVY